MLMDKPDMTPPHTDDPLGAFVPGPRCVRGASGHGPLDGLRLAVKDLIDVRGVVTGGGNPDWAATHDPAERDAPCVAACLAAGAALVGKTVTDELAFSLEGENAHHGTPLNPRAPGHLPGGSSSGSASAVAGGLADIALGTDTGGSVRIPAAFCGLFGMRPTHGRISLEGVLPFAPSLDTVGWFARDARTLRKLGRVLLGVPALNDDAPLASPLRRPPLVRIQRGFEVADSAVADALLPIAQAWGAHEVTTEVFQSPLDDWLRVYAVLQGTEIRDTLGPWIQACKPTFGPTIAPRFEGIFQHDEVELRHCQQWRTGKAHHFLTLLAREPQIWVMPTSPVPALPGDADATTRGQFYQTTLALCALAGLLGLPQLTVPVTEGQGLPNGLPNGLPLGLSLIGAPGTDLDLLDLAVQLTTP